MRKHHQQHSRHETGSPEAAPQTPLPNTTKPTSVVVDLPAQMYLIGCGTKTLTGASGQTMGFKAWNLLRMTELGLPVPPAFVLGTDYSVNPASRDRAATPEVWRVGLTALEAATGLAFGDAARPLLLSVRSGAAVSMPGMMETLLNIGLCDATISGLVRLTGNPRLAWDAYRRLVATYGEVVANLPAAVFESANTELFGARDCDDLDFIELRQLTHRYLELYAQTAGHPFPQQPEQQLSGAIGAVLASWNSAKASEYRRLKKISDAIGTAVTVQNMVFGNAGGRSGAGVGFTRDPASGERALWVDFLFNAQGEDVVSGRRSAQGHEELSTILPAVWLELEHAAAKIEQAFHDMQDFEFTVEDGKLFMLQSRDGKRTPRAQARIALDLFDEGIIDHATASARTAGIDRENLASSRIIAENGMAPKSLGRAATASSGIATGEIALDEARVKARHGAGVDIILVRRDAETADLAALELAKGLLTARGARTSHAAVIARQLGTVCLVGCADLQIDTTTRTIKFGDAIYHEGELLTLDGNSGDIYAGTIKTETDYPEDLLARLKSLRDSIEAQIGQPKPTLPLSLR